MLSVSCLLMLSVFIQRFVQQTELICLTLLTPQHYTSPRFTSRHCLKYNLWKIKQILQWCLVTTFNKIHASFFSVDVIVHRLELGSRRKRSSADYMLNFHSLRKHLSCISGLKMQQSYTRQHVNLKWRLRLTHELANAVLR